MKYENKIKIPKKRKYQAGKATHKNSTKSPHYTKNCTFIIKESFVVYSLS